MVKLMDKLLVKIVGRVFQPNLNANFHKRLILNKENMLLILIFNTLKIT